jgi:hypothetical protein
MVEDSERLRYPDLNVWGWGSGHSNVTETSYISHLRAELAPQAQTSAVTRGSHV